MAYSSTPGIIDRLRRERDSSVILETQRCHFAVTCAMCRCYRSDKIEQVVSTMMMLQMRGGGDEISFYEPCSTASSSSARHHFGTGLDATSRPRPPSDVAYAAHTSLQCIATTAFACLPACLPAYLLVPTKRRCYPSPANIHLALIRSVHRDPPTEPRGALELVCLRLQYAEAVPPAAATRRRRHAATATPGLGPWSSSDVKLRLSLVCDSVVELPACNLVALPATSREAKEAPTTWRPEKRPSTRYGTTWRGTLLARLRAPSLPFSPGDCLPA